MKQYLATARMCMKEKMYFGVGYLIGQYFLKAVSLGALLAIWHALFRHGSPQEGLTLSQMLAYTVLSSALDPMLNIRTPVSSWLHDGTILGLYQRPSSLFGQLTAHTVGGFAMPLCVYGMPVLLIAHLCGVNLKPASAWFYLSLPLCVAQGFAVDYLFACLMIRMRNLEWAMHNIRESLNALLTGALIPFAALPWGIGEWLKLSPLGTLAGAPLALYTGLDSAAQIIPAQLFWTLTLWPLAIYYFSRSKERLVSYGG